MSNLKMTWGGVELPSDAILAADHARRDSEATRVWSGRLSDSRTVEFPTVGGDFLKWVNGDKQPVTGPVPDDRACLCRPGQDPLVCRHCRAAKPGPARLLPLAELAACTVRADWEDSVAVLVDAMLEAGLLSWSPKRRGQKNARRDKRRTLATRWLLDSAFEWARATLGFKPGHYSGQGWVTAFDIDFTSRESPDGEFFGVDRLAGHTYSNLLSQDQIAQAIVRSRALRG